MFANVDGLLDSLAEALEVEEVEVTVRNRPSHHLGFTVVVGDSVFDRQESLAAGLEAALVAARAGEVSLPAEVEVEAPAAKGKK